MKVSWALVMAVITAALNWLVGFEWTALGVTDADVADRRAAKRPI